MFRELSVWGHPAATFQHLFRGDLAVLNEELVAFVPRINVVDGQADVRISAELPGVDEKDIQLRVTPQGLLLSGEKNQESDEKNKSFYRIERSYGHFERLIRLPDHVESEAAQATFKRGVLTIIVPKRAEKAPKTIEVKTE